MIKYLFLIQIIFFESSCVPEASQQINAQVNSQTSDPLMDEGASLDSLDHLNPAANSTQDKIEEDLTSTATVIDYRKEPFETTAFINPIPNMVDSGFFPGARVPSLQINYGTSDFVQVIRCVKSYEFKTHFGENISSLDSSVSSLQEVKTMWFNALRSGRSCKFVSYNTKTETLQDYTTPTGSFYYVINPCLSAESSSTNQEDCSYRLQFTNVIDYVEQIRDTLHAKAIELSVVEQNIQALLIESRTLAKLLETKIRACENTIAIENASKKQLIGMLDTLLYVGTFTTLLVTTGDLGNATMLAEIATQMGGMYLKQAIRLSEIPNSCLDAGEYTGVDMFTGFKTEASQRLASRFETMYGVMESYNRLEEILVDKDRNYDNSAPEGDGGFLGEALSNYSRVLYEMAEQDNRVLTLDQLQKTQ